MNVLLTSVGRRAYMVQYFKKILDGNGEVHVCNSDDLTVAFQYADKAFVSPLIYSDEYIPYLLEYCKKNKIDILLSLFDIDLLMLARHKKDFDKIGTRVIVSDEAFVGICNDKWKTYIFLKENGFNTPETFLNVKDALSAIENGKIQYPVMVKPRFGCGSISVMIAADEEELLYALKRVQKGIENTYLRYESDVAEDKVIIQELLKGQEYGVDIINDLNGKFKNAVVKKKLAMRAGETDIAETVDCPQIYELSKKLGLLSEHIANMDTDVFMVGNSPYILEMNVRFGGGYPFSHEAGCNLPQAIVNWCNGIEDDGLLYAKTGVKAFKELSLTVASKGSDTE